MPPGSIGRPLRRAQSSSRWVGMGKAPKTSPRRSWRILRPVPIRPAMPNCGTRSNSTRPSWRPSTSRIELSGRRAAAPHARPGLRTAPVRCTWPPGLRLRCRSQRAHDVHAILGNGPRPLPAGGFVRPSLVSHGCTSASRSRSASVLPSSRSMVFGSRFRFVLSMTVVKAIRSPLKRKFGLMK